MEDIVANDDWKTENDEILYLPLLATQHNSSNSTIDFKRKR